MINGVREGVWTGCYEHSGQKKWEVNYHAGARNGCITYRDGIKELEETFVDGERTNSILWYPNGQMMEQTTYSHGKPIGVSTSWYSSGHIKKRLTYGSDGWKSGVSTEWYPDPENHKMEEGSYLKDDKIGVWETWYTDGRRSSEVTYIDGKEDGYYSEWHPDGSKKVLGRFRDGKREGVWVWWDENGNREEKTFRRGRWKKPPPTN